MPAPTLLLCTVGGSHEPILTAIPGPAIPSASQARISQRPAGLHRVVAKRHGVIIPCDKMTRNVLLLSFM